MKIISLIFILLLYISSIGLLTASTIIALRNKNIDGLIILFSFIGLIVAISLAKSIYWDKTED